MTEDPIKIFATRAERYPEPTGADIVHGTARAALAVIPFVGGPVTEVLSVVLAPAVARRRDEWLKDLADALELLERKVEGFKIENLQNNEAFVSATLQASQIALRTHQQEKREYLRNVLLKIAVGKGPDETRQQIFLNAIEAFSPAHVKALTVIWRNFDGRNIWKEHSVPLNEQNYGNAIQLAAPELKGQVNLVDAILNDLRNRGFSSLSGAGASFPMGGIITNLGIEFLNFVLIPEGLPK